MSWQKDDAGITFYCDMPDCKSVLTYDIDAPSGPPGTDFIKCFADAKTRLGWVSFKRIGRPWRYFCKGCADLAGREHQAYNQREQERERQVRRNALYG
jgi:hypothetical protein